MEKKERKKVDKGLFIYYVIDHSDASKPSHRLTNGPKPSKTIESDGSRTKNH